MTYDSEGRLSAKNSDPSNFIVSEAAVLQRYDTNRKLVEWRTAADP